MQSAQALMRRLPLAVHNGGMHDNVSALNVDDLKGLSPSVLAEAAANMLKHIAEQAQTIQLKDEAIKFKDAKIERILFELARLKSWRFGAKTECMNAQQRELFEQTYIEEEASLQTQLQAVQGSYPDHREYAKRQPKRQPLPEHLRRVEHLLEPDNTMCSCGQAMVRIGEDVSEKLDIVPAEFFVHRHIRGKWVCRCCQTLVQEPVEPQVIDKGIPAPGLVAHTLVGHYADHLPYYRLESIHARSGVHTPRSTLAAWCGQAGAQLLPLYEAHREFVLDTSVLQADETPVNLLDPGAGKTARAYVWAYARGAFDAAPGVVYDFALGRGSKYPVAFLQRWTGTLVCDDFKSYEVLFKHPHRLEAGCLAHARRKFDELAKSHQSPVAQEAIRRIAWLYKIEVDAKELDAVDRLALRQQWSKPAWDALHAWLVQQRHKVLDGSAIAKAIDYSLNRWAALGQFLSDGDVPIDNNHIENQMRPWAMGRKAWLFAGSQLAGQRSAVVMSLVQSAKLNAHDPWAYLKDVLTRLPTYPNQKIEELLPHRWSPPHA